MGSTLVAFYLPGVNRNLAFHGPAFVSMESWGLTFLVSPPNNIPQYQPVMFCIMTELEEQKYHLIGVCMLA